WRLEPRATRRARRLGSVEVDDCPSSGALGRGQVPLFVFLDTDQGFRKLVARDREPGLRASTGNAAAGWAGQCSLEPSRAQGVAEFLHGPDAALGDDDGVRGMRRALIHPGIIGDRAALAKPSAAVRAA
ncbi:MAG: hypothetical protein ACO3UM_12345, partial [Planctomycetota bacterium]